MLPHASAIERAHRVFGEIDALMLLFEDKSYLDRETVAEAQRRFKQIKSWLDEDRRIGLALERQRGVSQIEHDYYSTAAKARTRLRAHWNTHPLRSHWIHYLADAKYDIQYFLFQVGDAPGQLRVSPRVTGSKG